MDGRLVGKVAVVTGASRGLGRSISAAFAAEGARVVMLARSGSELAQAARQIGDMAVPMVCDVTTPEPVPLRLSPRMTWPVGWPWHSAWR